jgi:hypothetical protein
MTRATGGKRERKPQRKCIFCGEGGIRGNPMTEEHLWPEWMHPYLPKIPGMRTQAGRHRFRFGEILVERKIREGHVFTRRFRLVCKRCNTTWMSAIEDDVKPILIPLLQGTTITLLRKARQQLAIWTALKVILTECIDPTDAVITKFEREDFRLKREMPRRLQIYIGTHDSQEWYTAYRHQHLLAHLGRNPPPPAERVSEFKNVQSTALGIGHVFSLSFVTTIQDLKLRPHVGRRQSPPAALASQRSGHCLAPSQPLRRRCRPLGRLHRRPRPLADRPMGSVSRVSGARS